MGKDLCPGEKQISPDVPWCSMGFYDVLRCSMIMITKKIHRKKKKTESERQTGDQQSNILIFAIWAKDIKSQATGQESLMSD